MWAMIEKFLMCFIIEIFLPYKFWNSRDAKQESVISQADTGPKGSILHYISKGWNLRRQAIVHAKAYRRGNKI
ncbi:hypothetical protein WB66_05055 [bacteria symbiont BFo1 of Frankliniella occidentalis]|jgi:hypothetical protein|nr:hypothetical protein AI28_17760 [bacteria symbiont BFo1 of Frankliniella occidentalis]KYP85866.1 hypothetical protein WB66_05055 [bacteria symbiont BFo1 of Frankliniella occidentalis]